MATTYKVQIGNEVRDATANEAAELDSLNEVLKEQAEAKSKSESDKVIKRESVITKLGLTADEVTALFG